jgi:hypothetical protein
MNDSNRYAIKIQAFQTPISKAGIRDMIYLHPARVP